ncbi:transcriptional regulator family: Fungal Specific TF [Penicillium riverlandense]|uniref:transcriptional regulator family: Fungal Specific TF n=1 Tax=Penicillium riverlandense TaxID=1903569 RepID=UPI002548ECC6|nr:transcriptional regulator family: Fungal Specific TF [Penicillium riverlandense]KAJ5833962.1 transcriptional regulator family: Fungal Specific TF [Penicillium riverlandense]
MAGTSTTAPSAWRIPKACQECRKRKIRCNGLSPCKTCQLRSTPCVYRDFIRQRRKRNDDKASQQRLDSGEREPRSRPASPSLPQSGRNASLMHDFPNSVSATHMASPSCQMQLYYGPTSHFSLMQHIYRDLISNHPAQLQAPSGQVEEAGAGLDLFSFRRIFFGTPDTHEAGKGLNAGEVSLTFLPYELAKLFLSRYLSTLYHLTPYRPKNDFELALDQLYNPSPSIRPDTLTQAIFLLALACGSLGTQYFTWGDILFEQVKASVAAFDDVVNHQTVQISLLMISSAYVNSEQGRPNSTFLHLGCAARKALSAGLHKDARYDDTQSQESIDERRTTLWSLYFFETWFCFSLGRPTSMSVRDIATECTQDPFIRLLVHLSQTISKSADQIYGQRHESLLHMWKVARSIAEDLRSHERQLEQTLGFGLCAAIQTGSLGVRQTIFTTCESILALLQRTILRTYSILPYSSLNISPFSHFSWTLAAGYENVAASVHE